MQLSLKDLTIAQLFELHFNAPRELARRGVIENPKNVIGGYGEFLFCKAMGWTKQNRQAYDAMDGSQRIQIKARTDPKGDAWTQVTTSDLRDLDKPEGQFEKLALLVLDDNANVVSAAVLPFAIAMRKGDMNERKDANGVSRRAWIYTFRRSLLHDPGVSDVTRQLAEAAKALERAADIASPRTVTTWTP